METINRAVRGYAIANIDKLDNRVENFMAGSLVENDESEVDGDKNILLVVSKKRLPKAVKKIRHITEEKNLEGSPLSGIIITGDGRHEFNIDTDPLCGEYIRANKIPVVSTALDTLGSMVKINRIEVQFNTRTPWKAARAIELIKNNVDLDFLLNSVGK